MNTKNLIITPTTDMPRETWLAFRQPKTHISKFIDDYFDNNLFTYEMLQDFFQSDEWKAFIFPCIGASEIATIMGLNKYKSVIELFYEKVGTLPVYDNDNVAMFWGRELEEEIAEKWQYWDGSPEGMIENFKNKKIIRRCRRKNAYIQNKNFAWIFVSLDRLINKDKTDDPKKYDANKEGTLECKTISGYSADQWENGFPPQYVVQVQTQIAATELEFGEMAILKDGRQMDVLPFDKHEELITKIIDNSKMFFENVKAASAQYFLSMYAPENQKKIHLAQIDQYCPEPDGSTSFADYLKERFKDTGGEILGTDEMLEDARNYLIQKEISKLNEQKETLYSNRLKNHIGSSSKIDFGSNGFVSWKADTRGTRRLVVKVKVELPAMI
jgi:putative phage-type endonuclease